MPSCIIVDYELHTTILGMTMLSTRPCHNSFKKNKVVSVSALTWLINKH